MKKNSSISLILLFVFSFVLVHNVIPHHHHDEVSEHEHVEHHHHHDQEEEKDHQNENDEPIGLFSHAPHILASIELLFNSTKHVQKTQKINYSFQTTDLLFKPVTIDTRHKPPNCKAVIPLPNFHSTHSHRGPPAFIS